MIEFKWLIAVRIFEALVLRTSFNPDEHWQANEVAHHLVFKEPEALLTWEWLPPAEIRGWAHPLVFAIFYKTLAITGLDTRWLVAWGPRLIQSFFAASCDVAVGVLGGERAQTLQLLNWFLAFCLPRTYSNSLETVLFTWSLVFYFKRNDALKTFLISALTLLIRPTSAVLFIPIGVHYLFVKKGSLSMVLPGALLYLVLTAVIDRIGYRHWVFVPWNFFKFNSMDGVSAMYGSHPFLWYFYAGLPFMLGPHIIPLAVALANEKVRNKHALLLSICLFAVLVFSLNPHKEFRFLLPLMPSLSVISAEARETRIVSNRFLLLTNLLMFAFFGLVHQAGPDAVMSELARVRPESVFFLMGCHQTAFAAHLHGIGVKSLRQLDCSPTNPKPLESDRFFIDPAGFAKREVFVSQTPSHVVVFNDSRFPELEPVLKTAGYILHSEHSHITAEVLGDERSMLIYRHRSFSDSAS
jgi:phosphatidylinositol glycan class B